MSKGCGRCPAVDKPGHGVVAGRLATDWGREPALWLRDRLAHSRWTACRSAAAPAHTAHSPNNGGKENKNGGINRAATTGKNSCRSPVEVVDASQVSPQEWARVGGDSPPFGKSSPRGSSG